MPRSRTSEALRRARLGGVALDKVDTSRVLELEDVLTPEGLMLIQCWVRDGLTVKQIAERLQVSSDTLYKWRYNHPELEEAFKKGKELVDYEVENALLKAALGYTKTKTIVYTGKLKSNGSRDVGEEKVVEEVGPNVTACLAWLNNRKSKDWQRNRDDSVSLEDKMSGVTIQIIKGNTAETVPQSSSNPDTTDDDWGDDDWGDDDWGDE